MQTLSRDLVRALAAANGLSISEDRLDRVQREYEGFVGAVAALEALTLDREVEPAHIFPLVSPAVVDDGRR